MENQMAKKDQLDKIIHDLQVLSAAVGDVSDIEERKELAQADLDSLNQARAQALQQKNEAEAMLTQAQRETQRRFDQDMFNKQGQLKSLTERVAALQKQVAELTEELDSKNGQLASVNGAMADARRRLMG
jgi:chromosome segregation ATPase